MIFIIWSFAQSQAQSKFWHLEKQWLSQIHDILILKPSPIYNSKYRYTGTKIDIFLCHLWTGKSFSTIIHIISYHRKGAVAFLSYYIFFPCLLFMCQWKFFSYSVFLWLDLEMLLFLTVSFLWSCISEEIWVLLPTIILHHNLPLLDKRDLVCGIKIALWERG